MSYETIKFEREDGFCVITLNRPEALNALNNQMRQDLDNALDEIMKDDGIKVFIYTGAPRPDGRPCFCAGGDLKEMASMQAQGQQTSSPLATLWALWAQKRPTSETARVFENISWCPKISIAAIDGVCTAGGTELALSCDIILASETAQISDMHIKNLGVVGGAGLPVNLAWRIGVAKALELCCTGDVIDGKEAYRVGLANHVFSPDKLLEGAKELAGKIASMRPAAVMMAKAICRSVENMDRRSSWHFNNAGIVSLSTEPDSAEWGPGRWVRQRKH